MPTPVDSMKPTTTTTAPAGATAAPTGAGTASRQRPRFRQSQRLGRNLRRHPRRQRLDGALPPRPTGLAPLAVLAPRVPLADPKEPMVPRDSQAPAVPAAPVATQDPVALAAPAAGGAVERYPFRLWGADASVQDTYGGLFQQWQALRDFYGLRRRRSLRAYLRRLRYVAGVHPLQGLDRRLDVALHRSGLVNSVAQARQLVSHGYVVVDGAPRRRPNAQLQAGQLVSLAPSLWRRVQEPAARSQWSRWQPGQGRLMPNYLEVDFRSGAFYVLGRCQREERLRPAERTPTADVLRLSGSGARRGR